MRCGIIYLGPISRFRSFILGLCRSESVRPCVAIIPLQCHHPYCHRRHPRAYTSAPYVIDTTFSISHRICTSYRLEAVFLGHLVWPYKMSPRGTSVRPSNRSSVNFRLFASPLLLRVRSIWNSVVWNQLIFPTIARPIFLFRVPWLKN